MRPLESRDVAGNWATLLLPLTADDSIDFTKLAEQLEALIAAGVDGVYTNGTAGEFYAQSEDEFDAIQELTAERCEAKGMRFQIGASHMSPHISVERIRRTRALRPGAFQVILPDWCVPSDSEIDATLERFADAADPIGLILYNPPHAKRILTPEDIGRLSRRLPALVGVKVADGDETWYAKMREHAGTLSWFVPGTNLATGLSRGAHGSYSSVACIQPAGAQRWYELMRTDMPAALEFESRVQDFCGEHILPFRDQQGFSNTALDKLQAAIGNWCDMPTRIRWPYRSISEDEAKRLRPIARERLPELF